MTVKELKESLVGVPEHLNVTICQQDRPIDLLDYCFNTLKGVHEPKSSIAPEEFTIYTGRSFQW